VFDPAKLDEFMRDYVWLQYKSPMAAQWKHATFDKWKAHIHWAKTLTGPQFLNSGIGSWWFHHYHTTGMGTYEELLKVKETEIDITELMGKTDEHIENYKWKKLSL
jgi:hypothetical protein